jgi:hypothetical protein
VTTRNTRLSFVSSEGGKSGFNAGSINSAVSSFLEEEASNDEINDNASCSNFRSPFQRVYITSVVVSLLHGIIVVVFVVCLHFWYQTIEFSNLFLWWMTLDSIPTFNHIISTFQL